MFAVEGDAAFYFSWRLGSVAPAVAVVLVRKT